MRNIGNITELKNKALDILDKYYPTVECAILTGSQLEPEFVAPSSDIDIVLISKKFSGLTSNVVKMGETKIDFTRLSLNLIQTLLIDNAYDHQGIVLTMLGRGIVLKDDYNIYSQIGNFASTLLKRGNLSANTNIKELRREMIKLKKHLKKNLEYPFYFFMLADFIKLVSSFHLFTINNGQYDKDAFRIVKSIYYKEGSLDFPITLYNVVNKAIKDIDKYRPVLMYYIDKYLDMAFPVALQENDVFIINIQTLYPSHTNFYSKAINAIVSNYLLSKYFCYCQINSSANTFPNKFILFFKTNVGLEEQQLIIQTLFDVFDEVNMRITHINTIQSDYLKYIFPDQQIYEIVESILNKVSRVNVLVGKTKKYDSQKAIMICFILAVILAKRFNMNRNDIKKVCGYLFRRWRPSRIISNLQNEWDIQRKNKAFFQYNSYYYYLNERIFYKIYQAINADNNIEFEELDISIFEKVFSEFVKKASYSIIPLKELYKYLFQVPDLNKASIYYYYTNLLEMITTTLGVEFEDRSKLAFIIRKIYV